MKGKPFRDQDNRALHERRMKERTRIVVTQKNIEYILAHQHDSREELARYLRQCKKELGHVPAQSEIIGGGKGASPMAYVRDSIKVIKEIDPNIMVEQAAGITCGQEVYDFIMAGSEAAGAASGIMNAADPIAMIDEMIAATRRAADDLKKQEG